MQWVRNLCRLCGQIGDICYNIFDSSLGIQLKVERCLHLQISADDFKPKEICRPCYINITTFLEFIDLCLTTNSKYESICYGDQYGLSVADKIFYEPVHSLIDGHKQSVIVSNRPAVEQNCIQYQHVNKTDNMTLASCEPRIIDFSVNYTQAQACELNNFFPNTKQTNIIELSSSDKNINNEIQIEGLKTTSSCSALEGTIPNDLLVGLENDAQVTMVTNQLNMPKPGKNKQLISVEDVKKSVENQNMVKPVIAQSSKSSKSYSCPHCEKKFKRRINLTAHISSHTNIKSFKCSYCSKAFAVKCHLTQHNKTHSELFKCNICQKTFQVPSKLSRHMQTHSTNRPFVCNFNDCRRAFSDKNNLKQHVICHSSSKNLSCNICEKLFKTRKNLNAHIKIHVSEKMYQCNFCDKTFRYKHNLKAHIIRHES